jgi:hypothetical protein
MKDSDMAKVKEHYLRLVRNEPTGWGPPGVHDQYPGTIETQKAVPGRINICNEHLIRDLKAKQKKPKKEMEKKK